MQPEGVRCGVEPLGEADACPDPGDVTEIGEMQQPGLGGQPVVSVRSSCTVRAAGRKSAGSSSAASRAAAVTEGALCDGIDWSTVAVGAACISSIGQSAGRETGVFWSGSKSSIRR